MKKNLIFCLIVLSLGGISCSSGVGRSSNMTKSGGGADIAGNGGDVVEIGGEKYALADLFFEPHPGAYFHLSTTLLSRVKELDKALFLWGLDATEFIKEIFDPRVRIILTTTLPTDCSPAAHSTSSGLPAIPFACTRGWYTWIIPKYYFPLSFEEKVGAIMHERLHAFKPEQPHEVISPFIKGIIIFQNLREELRQQRCFDLTAKQVREFGEMRFAASQLDMIVEPGQIDSHGGSLITAQVSRHPTSCLGLSRVGEGVVLDEYAFVVSSIVMYLHAHHHSSLVNSSFDTRWPLKKCWEIGPYTVINESTISDSNMVNSEGSVIGEKVRIDRTKLGPVVIAERSKIIDSVLLDVSFLKPASISNTEIYGTSFEDVANISNSFIDSNIRFQGPVDAEESRFECHAGNTGKGSYSFVKSQFSVIATDPMGHNIYSSCLFEGGENRFENSIVEQVGTSELLIPKDTYFDSQVRKGTNLSPLH